MSLDHITMTSVDLTSRLTGYKLTPCNIGATSEKPLLALV